MKVVMLGWINRFNKFFLKTVKFCEKQSLNTKMSDFKWFGEVVKFIMIM